MIKFRLPKISLVASVAISVALVASAFASVLATPKLVQIENAPDLESTVPKQFGEWKELPSRYTQVGLTTGQDPNMDQPYDQTVMRTYVSESGQVVMLSLAWGRRQRQEVKIHRPDLCYVAQGYKVKSLVSATYTYEAPSGNTVAGKRMVAMSSRNGEAVTYWIRIGELYSEDAIQTRLHILKEGLAGQVPDGILVRVSQPIRSEKDADLSWPVLERFLDVFVASLPPETRSMLIR